MTKTTTAPSGRHLPEPGPRPNREQRVTRGKAARAEVPRASHAEFTPGL